MILSRQQSKRLSKSCYISSQCIRSRSRSGSQVPITGNCTNSSSFIRSKTTTAMSTTPTTLLSNRVMSRRKNVSPIQIPFSPYYGYNSFYRLTPSSISSSLQYLSTQSSQEDGGNDKISQQQSDGDNFALESSLSSILDDIENNNGKDYESSDNDTNDDDMSIDSTSSTITSDDSSSMGLLSLLSDEDSFTNVSEVNNGYDNDNNDYGSAAELSKISDYTDYTNDEEEETTNKQIKKKRKRKKPKAPSKAKRSSDTDTDESKDIPQLQTKHNAQLLFDSIGPHINEEQLKQFLDEMSAFVQFMETELSSILRESKGNASMAKKKRKKKKLTQKDIREYQTTIGIIDAFVKRHQSKKKKKKKGKKNKVTSDDDDNEIHINDQSWKDQNWVKSLLAQFFANNKVEIMESNKDDDTTTATPLTATPSPPPISEMTMGLKYLWNDSKFTPNINRTNYEKNIQTLINAREMSIISPLEWSHGQKKKKRKKRMKEKETKGSLLQSSNGINVHVALMEGGWSKSEGTNDDDDDSSGIMRSHEEEMTNIHNQKPINLLREEAEDMARLLADRLPSDTHARIMTMFEEYAEHLTDPQQDGDDDVSIDIINTDSEITVDHSDKGEKKIPPKKPVMRMLFHHLEQNADFHVHLIAPEIASFLYVDAPWFKNNSFTQIRTDPQADDSTTLQATGGTAYDTYKTFNETNHDPRISEAWKCWFSIRDAMVKTFLRSQRAYCELQKGIVEAENTKKKLKDKKSKSKSTSEDGIKFSNNEHGGAEELFEELDMMRTTESGKKVGRDYSKEEIERGRNPRNANLRFECHMLNDKFGPYSTPESSILADIDGSPDNNTICPEIANQLPETNRTIFVDNLPIDISEEELDDLYSRCGDIKSIKIFNLRPELDPGELKPSALKALKKKRRMTGMKGVKYSRQRTPIYAVITFHDEDSFDKASNDMLRIFGMVIRRHAARSNPARSLFKLYIENIPDGLYAIDVEEKLSKVLYPNVYVSLEIGQHVNSQPSNLVLTFPSYEVAHYAYGQLQTVDFGSDECTFNWMATPKDSMAHWTRKISPDP